MNVKLSPLDFVSPSQQMRTVMYSVDEDASYTLVQEELRRLWSECVTRTDLVLPATRIRHFENGEVVNVLHYDLFRSAEGNTTESTLESNQGV